jgi:hypothetical protein
LALLAASIVAFLPNGARSDEGRPTPAVIELCVLPARDLRSSERVLAQTLQGLANRRTARVWLEGGGLGTVLLQQLREEGTAVREVADVWDLVRRFPGEVKGAIVYRLNTPSLNVATSLCGPMNAVAVEESLLERAKAEGLAVVYDARGQDERLVYERHAALFARGLVVEQRPERSDFLRDYAVGRNAFTFDAGDRDTRTRWVKAFGPGALVFGWGRNVEHPWVVDVSRGGGAAVPADFCVNLSALERLPAEGLRPPARPAPPPAREGERIVAFVLTDGDNIQWLTNGMALDKKFFGSPHRGKFAMTWELSPLLAAVAPRVLKYYYDRATPRDGFVAAGAPGYSYLHFVPDRRTAARQTAEYLRRSGLDVAAIINDNGGSMDDVREVIAEEDVAAMLYKDFAPYHRRRGAVQWFGGKPCAAFRFVLWQGLKGGSIREVAEAVARMPASPRTDPGSYALVSVHAWSFRDIGGPLEAVKRTIDALPPGTRVVTAGDLLTLMRKHLHPQEVRKEGAHAGGVDNAP